ncbi:unnamed protein product [Anisakis simplex]|uniref:CBS domain-containing protein n=1 Tax=Anisakis simplex TaxID=6269 RepID=A0A0M3K6T8_ANISI|nr:unnamed protein product [Anisakis simplex]
MEHSNLGNRKRVRSASFCADDEHLNTSNINYALSLDADDSFDAHPHNYYYYYTHANTSATNSNQSSFNHSLSSPSLLVNTQRNYRNRNNTSPPHHTTFTGHSYSFISPLRTSEHPKIGGTAHNRKGLTVRSEKEWMRRRLEKRVDLLNMLDVDDSPLQLVEQMSLYKAHSLFSLLGVSRAYVTRNGVLVGVISLNELRLGIALAERYQSGLISNDQNCDKHHSGDGNCLSGIVVVEDGIERTSRHVTSLHTHNNYQSSQAKISKSQSKLCDQLNAKIEMEFGSITPSARQQHGI